MAIMNQQTKTKKSKTQFQTIKRKFSVSHDMLNKTKMANAALTDRKALWVLDYSAVQVTIDMAGEREHQKVPITSRVRLSLIYLVVSSLSVIKPKINESPVSIMIKIPAFKGHLDMICIWYPFECDMGLDGTRLVRYGLSECHLNPYRTRMDIMCIFSHEITINLSFTTKKHIIELSQPPLQTTECDMASDQNCA